MPTSTDFTSWLAQIATVATAIAVLGALLFAWLQLRVIRETRHAEVMSKYFERWHSETLRTARRMQARKSPTEMLEQFQSVREAANEDYYILINVPDFFEDLALSVRHRAVTLEIVEDWIGSAAVGLWDRWSLVAAFYRAELNQNAAYEKWESLRNDIRTLSELRYQRALGSRPRAQRGELGTRITGR